METPRSASQQQFGRERFLQRIARLRRHPVSIEGGMTQAAALSAIFSKLGVSPRDLAEIRAKADDYTRAVGESFISSLKREQLSGMSYLSNSAQFAADFDYPGKGRSLQMKGVGIHSWGFGQADGSAPDPPPSEYLPPDGAYRDCLVFGAGVGDGNDWPWVTDDGRRGKSCDIEFKFSFTPAVTNTYIFSSFAAFGGSYYLVANKGVFDSKQAYCDVSCYLAVDQPLSTPVTFPDGTVVNEVTASTPVVDLFEEDGQNILDGGKTAGSTKLELASLLLIANQPAYISVTFQVTAWATGDGSVAELNLARPTGAIACGGLFIS
jgi:hypothetical protein